MNFLAAIGAAMGGLLILGILLIRLILIIYQEAESFEDLI